MKGLDQSESESMERYAFPPENRDRGPLVEIAIRTGVRDDKILVLITAHLGSHLFPNYTKLSAEHKTW